jgi:hypothetical protein
VNVSGSAGEKYPFSGGVFYVFIDYKCISSKEGENGAKPA